MTPGARVRVAGVMRPGDDSVREYVGKVGQVEARRGAMWLVVFCDQEATFHEHELTVMPAQCIKAGDRVRVVQACDTYLADVLGQCGTVHRWTSDDPEWDGEDWENVRIVRFDDGSERAAYWEELELVEVPS